MTAKPFGGGEGLFARDLKNQDLDGALTGGDDEPITVGLDDFAGGALALNDMRSCE